MKPIVTAAVVVSAVVAVPLYLKFVEPAAGPSDSAAPASVGSGLPCTAVEGKPGSCGPGAPHATPAPRFVDLGTTTCAPCKVMLGVMSELEQRVGGSGRALLQCCGETRCRTSGIVLRRWGEACGRAGLWGCQGGGRSFGLLWPLGGRHGRLDSQHAGRRRGGIGRSAGGVPAGSDRIGHAVLHAAGHRCSGGLRMRAR